MKQKGFTIIELLIVLVVFGILLALIITTYQGIKKRGENFNYCEMYRYSSIKDVPAQCFNYFTSDKADKAAGDVE